VSAALVAVVIALVGGYVAGRCHGRSKHHAWVAKGFWVMHGLVVARGLGDRPNTELTCSGLDVSRAFGSHRREADRRGE